MNIDYIEILETNINNTCLEYRELGFRKFITKDMKFLCLSYIYCSDISEYDEMFDELNEKFDIYNTVEQLYFETDFISELPSYIKKFTKLLDITVYGSRWFNLTLEQVPKSIEIVKFIEQTNLSNNVLNGCAELHYLKTLSIDGSTFNIDDIIMPNVSNFNTMNQDPDELIPVPDLPNLKKIILWSGTSYPAKYLDPEWETIILNHPLFVNVKERINFIILSPSNLTDSTIVIELSDE
jgi:hypothetical protein